MLISDRYHVTYCTNIHPGKDWKITFESLKKYVPKVKRAIAPYSKFGLGLRLSNLASEELGLGDKLEEFKYWLDKNDSYIFTMNGFPYGSFHGETIKDKVHQPDWTTTQRFEYTSRIFKQLAVLIPEGISGGISTSPISYRHWHKNDSDISLTLSQGAQKMVQIAVELHQTEKETGKYLHLDIEPEPDGLLENSDEVLAFFNNYLIPEGNAIFHKEFGLEKSESDELIKRYLTICYDICHFSLAFEDPKLTFKKLNDCQIKIGKIQVSAALKVISDAGDQKELLDSLAKFDEPTYLHQVTEKLGKRVITYRDLPIVLNREKQFEELRAHFHVPIFIEQYDRLYSTQDQILKVLECLATDTMCEHLEVETYTWEVLPQKLKLDLTESIVREVQWLLERL